MTERKRNTQHSNMQRDVWKAWWKEGRPGAIAGQAFDEAMAKWVQDGRHSSGDAPHSLVEYTALNAVRMRRVAKNAKVPPSLSSLLESGRLRGQQWTVITESWCGDAAQTGPLMATLAERAGIVIQWVLRDSAPPIIEDFLTDGAKSIPLWIISSSNGEVLGQWGPRPKELQELVSANKKQPEPVSKGDMAIQIQLWYAKNRGGAFFAESESLLRSTALS